MGSIGNSGGFGYQQQQQQNRLRSGEFDKNPWSWSGAGKGAMSGASTGGSIGGPWGAIIGGVGGGILGGRFGGEEGSKGSTEEQANRQMMLDYYNSVRARQAPQMGPAAQGSLSSFRGNQSDLVTRLEAMSKGQGPSLAAQQLRAAQDRNAAQQHSFANSGRGGPLAAQVAANNVGLLGAQSAQDSASARIAEQQAALNQLGLTLHGARGADEEMSRFNAGQSNEASARNLEAKLRTMGMSDEAITRILAQMNENARSKAARPSGFDQLLAGSAGLASLVNSNKASDTGGKSAAGGGLGGDGSDYYTNY